MTTILSQAKENLFRRPPEEHFESFALLRAAAAAQRARCREIESRDVNILFGESGEVFFGDHAVLPTPYALAQLATIARVPMPVLERLEVPTRASVLNQCMERSRRFRIGLADGDRLRAVTSDRYERVWDDELCDAIDRWLLPSGFIPAVPTRGDGNNARGNRKPALFRSDRDSFAFFYSERPPADSFGGLRKGVVVFNSEVGAKSLGFATFVFREMCQNFLIWGAGEVVERTARHVGQVREVFREFDRELRRIADALTSDEMRVIERASLTPFVPGFDAEKAEDRLTAEFKVPRRLVPDILESALRPDNPGDLTIWGVANGIASVAKDAAFTDERVQLQRTAGLVLAAR